MFTNHLRDHCNKNLNPNTHFYFLDQIHVQQMFKWSNGQTSLHDALSYLPWIINPDTNFQNSSAMTQHIQYTHITQPFNSYVSGLPMVNTPKVSRKSSETVKAAFLHHYLLTIYSTHMCVSMANTTQFKCMNFTSFKFLSLTNISPQHFLHAPTNHSFLMFKAPASSTTSPPQHTLYFYN